VVLVSSGGEKILRQLTTDETAATEFSGSPLSSHALSHVVRRCCACQYGIRKRSIKQRPSVNGEEGGGKRWSS